MRESSVKTKGKNKNQPASLRQRDLWYEHQLHPGDPGYNLGLCFSIDGILDKAVLNEAADYITGRHDQLRARFQVNAAALNQTFAPSGQPVMWHSDVIGDEADAIRLLEQSADRPYDMVNGPLFRIEVFSGRAKSYLGIFAHHSVADFWSFRIITNDLFRACRELANSGKCTAQSKPRKLYSDLVLQDAGLQNTTALATLEDHYQRLFDPHPLVLKLVQNRSKTKGSNDFRNLNDRILPTVTIPLRSQARALGITPYVLTLSAFATTIHRFLDQEDVMIGTSTTGRGLQYRDVVGYFSTQAGLRLHCRGDMSFRELVMDADAQVKILLNAQHIPLSAVTRHTQAAAPASAAGNFQVMLVWHKEPRKRPDLGLPYDVLPIAPQRGAPHDLTLFVRERADELDLTWNFDANRLDAHAIEQFAASFKHVLTACTNAPDVRLQDVEIVTSDQARWLDEYRSGPHVPLSENDCWHYTVLRIAKENPDRVAVQDQDGGELTYAELVQRAQAVAKRLETIANCEGEIVAVEISEFPALLVGLLGATLAGAAYMPLDPASIAKRRERFLNTAKPAVILQDVIQNKHEPDDNWPKVKLARNGKLHEKTPNMKAGPSKDTSADSRITQLSDIAYVLFTSGTTGNPKGVMVTHLGLSNYLKWASQTYASKGQTVLSILPVTFDASVTTLILPLYRGETILHISKKKVREELASVLSEKRCYSILKLTPAHLQLTANDHNLRKAGCDAQVIVVGGEALPATTCNDWFQISPQAKIINEYGPTETVVGCCVHHVKPADLTCSSIPIGRPIANTCFHVLDTCGKRVPPGASGELYIGGAGVAQGYLNAPVLTAEKFVADHVTPARGRLYRSGDMVRYLADGSLDYLGRKDAQLKIRGYRVDPAEIEEALYECSEVTGCAVLAKARDHETILVAYIVSDPSTTRSMLLAHLRSRLPHYMLPAHFVRLSTLPLTNQGKIDRNALVSGGTLEMEDGVTFVAPRTETEQTMLHLWREFLAAPEIGTQHDFFDSGGTSLTITRLFEAYAQHFPDRFEIADLFSLTTVAAQAEFFDRPDAEKSDDMPINEIEF